jgi:hypothetical protein
VREGPATGALVAGLVGLTTDILLGEAFEAALAAAGRRDVEAASSLELDAGSKEALLAGPDTSGLLPSAPALWGVFFLRSSVAPTETLGRWAAVAVDAEAVAATGERFAAAWAGGRTAGLLRVVPGAAREDGVVGLVAGLFVAGAAAGRGPGSCAGSMCVPLLSGTASGTVS